MCEIKGKQNIRIYRRYDEIRDDWYVWNYDNANSSAVKNTQQGLQGAEMISSIIEGDLQ